MADTDTIVVDTNPPTHSFVYPTHVSQRSNLHLSRPIVISGKNKHDTGNRCGVHIDLHVGRKNVGVALICVYEQHNRCFTYR
jgi:hypothetical protein